MTEGDVTNKRKDVCGVPVHAADLPNAGECALILSVSLMSGAEHREHSQRRKT
jgi:hypothetical protein